MNQDQTISVEKALLQKFAEFTKLVLSELKSLRVKVASQQDDAEFADSQYTEAVTKVANALYDADLDFVTENFDRKQFIKKALDDKTYVARTLEKVCKAADVSTVGKLARVKAVDNSKIAFYDPVYAAAFGHTRNNKEYTLEDLDD